MIWPGKMRNRSAGHGRAANRRSAGARSAEKVIATQILRVMTTSPGIAGSQLYALDQRDVQALRPVNNPLPGHRNIKFCGRRCPAPPLLAGGDSEKLRSSRAASPKPQGIKSVLLVFFKKSRACLLFLTPERCGACLAGCVDSLVATPLIG